ERWAYQHQDHGFNGTPVWRIAAGLLTNLVPLNHSTVIALASVDSVLLILMWVLVYWAFGVEAASAALIFWGTNFAARFFWTG
ncbi:MAG: hypothetical protein EBZ48_05115, partial [Proteobacteria bacterium]|nr:hypothetical protein [Pseudomonadota bacterium]